jgi:hypothetical protein
VRIRCFWSKLYQVPSKANNLNVYTSKKNKGSKQDIQNQLRTYMPEGGEPYLCPREENLIYARGRTLSMPEGGEPYLCPREENLIYARGRRTLVLIIIT